MENQIKVQETKTMNLLKPLKNGKDHSLAVAHFEESNLLQSSEEDIKIVFQFAGLSDFYPTTHLPRLPIERSISVDLPPLSSLCS